MDFEELLAAYLSWDYDMAMGSFEAAPGSWPPAPPPATTTARRLRDVLAPIGEHAIWSPTTNEVLDKLDQDSPLGAVLAAGLPPEQRALETADAASDSSAGDEQNGEANGN